MPLFSRFDTGIVAGPCEAVRAETLTWNEHPVFSGVAL